MVELGTEGIKSENDIGGDRPKPGRYLTVINDVDETFEKNSSVVIGFRVLSGTTPGQEKKVHVEYFSVSEAALPRLVRLGLACGLIPPNDPPREREFVEAIGLPVVIEIISEEYQGKTKTKISFAGMWSVNNPEVADVPKDAEALKLLAVPSISPPDDSVSAAPPAKSWSDVLD